MAIGLQTLHFNVYMFTNEVQASVHMSFLLVDREFLKRRGKGRYGLSVFSTYAASYMRS